MRRIHRSPVNSPHKGRWRRALVFSLICAWINGWVNNSEAGDLRRQRAHFDVIVMAIASGVPQGTWNTTTRNKEQIKTLIISKYTLFFIMINALLVISRSKYNAHTGHLFKSLEIFTLEDNDTLPPSFIGVRPKWPTNCHGKTWRLLCPFFSGIFTCGRTSRETVSHPQRPPLPTQYKISLPVYVIVTNKRLQPLTTTWYNSLMLYFSLLKI